MPTLQQTFSIDSADMLALEDDITSKVTSALGLWLIGNEKKLLAKRQTDNEDALRLYMKGRVFLGLKRNRENIQKAIQFFQQAIDLDPAFAQAYTGLADCYVLASNVAYGPIPTKEAMDKAHWNVKQALDIDPSLSETHASLGTIKLRYDWDWQQAEQEFKQAIDLDPDYAPAHFGYSNLLAVMHRFDESIRQSEIAKELDPYSAPSDMNYGRALYYARRFEAAADYFNRLLKQKPDYAQFQHMMGLVLLKQGKYPEAIVILERLHSVEPLYAAAALGYAYAKEGRRDEALKMIDELDQFSKQKPIPPHEKALIYIGLAEKDQVFQLLERAYQERFPNLVYLTTDPIYDDLRSDQRFGDLARRINLTP
jgi:tetratricopeptide (TPR) repeat protein